MSSQRGGEAGRDQLLEAAIMVVARVGRPGLRRLHRSRARVVRRDRVVAPPERRWRGRVCRRGRGRAAACPRHGAPRPVRLRRRAGCIGATALLMLSPIGSRSRTWLARGCGSGHDPDVARWAGAADERRITVPRTAARRANRIVAGTSKSTGRRLAGEDCVSAVVIGPNGSGKTVGLIIPNTLEWQGSVVMTTAKPQDLDPVLRARRTQGPVWVVAPGGVPGVADRVLVAGGLRARRRRCRPDGRLAGRLLRHDRRCARQAVERPGPQVPQGTAAGGPPLRWRDRRRFIEWAYDGELASDHVSQVLSEHGHVEVLREYRSTWRIHEEGKGSVMFTAFGLADTYNRPGVLDSSQHGATSPSPTCSRRRPATLLLVTPQSEVERFTPYFTALISAIVHEAEQRAAQTGGPVSPRLLLALDEAGNVFRYPRLPHLLTTARGNGVQLLLAYHDIAQIEHLFGGRDVARTILSNAKLRVLLPGVGDVETLRYFSELLGQTKVSVGSRQTEPGRPAVTHRGRPSRSPGAAAPAPAAAGRRGGPALREPASVAGEAPALVQGPGPAATDPRRRTGPADAAAGGGDDDRDRQPGDRRAARRRLRPRAGRDRSPPPRSSSPSSPRPSRISPTAPARIRRRRTAHAGRSSGPGSPERSSNAPGPRSPTGWGGSAAAIPWPTRCRCAGGATPSSSRSSPPSGSRGATRTSSGAHRSRPAPTGMHGGCPISCAASVPAAGTSPARPSTATASRASTTPAVSTRPTSSQDASARQGHKEPPITGGEVMDVEEMKAALQDRCCDASGRASGLARRATR